MTGERQAPREQRGSATINLVSRAGEILDRTGLALVEGVTLGQFANSLSQLVSEVTVLALSVQPRGKRAGKIEQLGKAYETYVRLAEELRKEDFYPPMPPLSLRQDIERWIADMRGFIDNPGEDHSRRGTLYHFYPRIAGLFYAAFGEEPTSWCGEDGKGSRLVEFAYHSISFARETVDLPALTGRAGVGSGTLTNPWSQRSTAAIHGNMKKILAEGLEPSTEEADPRVPGWVAYYGYFHDLLRR